MLDPELRQELLNTNKTVSVMHLSMLVEPVVYVLVAFLLKSAADFQGLERSQDFIPAVRSIFLIISVLAIPAVVSLRRFLFSPERIAPADADVEKIAMRYSRSQLIIDAVAAVPATLGFVLFLLGGKMDLLFVLSAVSIAIMVLIFPRYETLEQAAIARMIRGETIPLQAKRASDHVSKNP